MRLINQIVRFGFFLILVCMSSLYILDTNSFSDTWFANTFSHSIGCLSTLFMASSDVQKLLGLIRSHLFTCLFLHLLLWEVLDLSATIIVVMVSVSIHPDSSNCTH